MTPRKKNDHIEHQKNPSPEMEATLRKRKAALLERSKTMELAWREWQKPLLKPGDFVVVLRPCATREDNQSGTLLTSVDKNSRLLIVHRFWREREERSRHAFFVSGVPI